MANSAQTDEAMVAKCFAVAYSGCGTYNTPTASGVPIRACPAMLTHGGSLQSSGLEVGTECKRWCDNKPVACNAAMQSFCAHKTEP